MLAFDYHKATVEEAGQLVDAFCTAHGDDARGIISDAEYDRLFDGLAEALRRRGTFTEDGGEADFSGYRYVDQLPWIVTVPQGASPDVALAAGLEAVSHSHRPLAVQFDFYPQVLLILPPNRVFTTFEQSAFTASA